MDAVLTGLDTLFATLPYALEAAAATIAAASAITALTPTPRDDTVVGKLYKALEIVALNIGRAKDRAPRGAPAQR